MNTDELAEALRAGEAAPESVLGEDWELARRMLDGEPVGPDALPAELALAVLEAAVALRRVAPAEQLATSSDREVAKAARRALYRLRSAGVATPERERPAEAPAPAAPPPAETLPGFASLPDGTGQRALLLAHPVRGGVEVVEALVSDELGLLSLSRAEMSRSAWRKLARRPEMERLLPLPAEEGRALLAEAVRRNLETRTPFPPDADVALRHLGIEAETGELAPLPPPEEGDAVLAVESGALHREPEFAAWLPPEPELKRLALRVDELRTSPLALSPEQQAEALRERIRAQAEEFFDEPRRRLYARRLWAVAPALERRGAEHLARVARATARRLFHGSAGLFPPFAEQLFTKVLALMARPAGGRGAARTGAGVREEGGGDAPGPESPPGERGARAASSSPDRMLDWSDSESWHQNVDVREALADPRAQQQVQVLVLPGLGPVEVVEAALVLHELGRVDAAPAVVTPAGPVHVVEHLVKDDPLHEVPGHLRLVERRMDADDPRVRRVAAHLDALPRTPAPRSRTEGDGGADAAGEVPAVEGSEDGRQVVVPADGLDAQAPAELRRRDPADEGLVPLDEPVEDGRAPRVGRPDELREGRHHLLGRGQEHVVHAQPPPAAHPLEGHHGVGVVVNLHPDLGAEPRPQPALEHALPHPEQLLRLRQARPRHGQPR